MRCTKTLFVLATVVIASVAVCGCSSKNEETEQRVTPNTITIDGKEKTILQAVYTDFTLSNDYQLALILSQDRNERVEINFNTTNHANKDINLAKRDDASQEGGSWKVNYYDAAGNLVINTWGQSKENYNEGEAILPVFIQGRMRIAPGKNNDINIFLKDGEVIGKDGKKHTIIINYDGKTEK